MVLEREPENILELFVVVLAARLHDRDVEDKRCQRQLLRFRKLAKLGLPMSLVVEHMALKRAKARHREPPSPDRRGRGSAGPQGSGAEQAHYVCRVVRGTERISSAPLPFGFGQLTRANVAAWEDARLLFEARENPKTECRGRAPLGTRERP